MVELNGKELRDKLILKLKEDVEKLSTQLGLVVIQVGEDEASKVYVRQKERLALELGYKFIHKVYPDSVDNVEIIEYIESLNNDDSIDGIIVQMPLPKHLNTSVIQNTISPNKDVDGLTFSNSGKLLHGVPSLVPCTPKGIVDLLDEHQIEISGKNIVIIGRSILVGKPIANLLTNRNATVTICHSKTENIQLYTQNADIVIVAVGSPAFLKADMVKPGSVIIDVGINRINGKLYGDVDYENVAPTSSYITPVPGGVGPMTVYELMHNVYLAHQLLEEERKLEKANNNEKVKKLELTHN